MLLAVISNKHISVKCFHFCIVNYIAFALQLHFNLTAIPVVGNQRLFLTQSTYFPTEIIHNGAHCHAVHIVVSVSFDFFELNWLCHIRKGIACTGLPIRLNVFGNCLN